MSLPRALRYTITAVYTKNNSFRNKSLVKKTNLNMCDCMCDCMHVCDCNKKQLFRQRAPVHKGLQRASCLAIS